MWKKTIEIHKKLFLKSLITYIVKRCNFTKKNKEDFCNSFYFCDNCKNQIQRLYNQRFEFLQKCKTCNRSYNQYRIKNNGFLWSKNICNTCYFLKDL